MRSGFACGFGDGVDHVGVRIWAVHLRVDHKYNCNPI